uniref:Secreted protein n=1 Tax=Pediastrum angulosum TaxID=271408 RepID=A0A2U8GHI7_9CHLO|nr:hypothetical protein [Pediastrum angulosum]AWI68157.1 hypothetical protein [Pediastrum angulosum]
MFVLVFKAFTLVLFGALAERRPSLRSASAPKKEQKPNRSFALVSRSAMLKHQVQKKRAHQNKIKENNYELKIQKIMNSSFLLIQIIKIFIFNFRMFFIVLYFFISKEIIRDLYRNYKIIMDHRSFFFLCNLLLNF